MRSVPHEYSLLIDGWKKHGGYPRSWTIKMIPRHLARYIGVLLVSGFFLNSFPERRFTAEGAMPLPKRLAAQASFNAMGLQEPPVCFHELAGEPLIGALCRFDRVPIPNEVPALVNTTVSRRGALARLATTLGLGGLARDALGALAFHESLNPRERADAQAAYNLILAYLPGPDRTLLENGLEFYGVVKIDMAKLYEDLDKALVLPRPLDMHSESVKSPKNPQNISWRIFISPGDFAIFAALLADLAYETAGMLDVKYGLATSDKTHNQVIIQAAARALRTLRSIRNNPPSTSKPSAGTIFLMNLDAQIRRLEKWQKFWSDAPQTPQTYVRTRPNGSPAPGRKMEFRLNPMRPDARVLSAG